MNIITLGLSRSKYAQNIPVYVDGFIYDFVEDLEATKTMETIAEMQIFRIMKNKGIKQKRGIKALLTPDYLKYNHVQINLYITGYTSMLLSVLNVCYSYGIKVICYHYNRKNGGFFPQEVYS